MANTKVPVELSSTPSIVDNGNATAITIDSSERVGIGSSPSKELDVAGTIRATGADNSNTIEVFGGTITNQSFGLLVDAGTSAADYAARFRKSDNTVIMEVSGSGNVGIGQTSPSAKIHATIEGSVPTISSNTVAVFNRSGGLSHEAYVSIIGGASGSSALHFGDTDDEDVGRIEYRHDSNYMAFNTNAAERMRIDSSGRILIGTTTATELLNVAAGSGSGAAMEFAGNGTTVGSTSMFVGHGSNNDGYVYQRANSPLIFGTNNSERMRIASNGRTSIGTTTTNAGLTVANGDIRATGAAFANDANSISMSQESSGGVITARGPSTATRGSIALSVNKSNGGDGITGLKIENDGGLFAFGIAYASASSDVNYNASTGEIFVVSSSRRYKSNITDLNIDTSKILSLRPVSYIDNESETNSVGLIAEEVHEEIPQLVNYKEIEGYDEIQPDSVKYSTLSVYLLKAIQEQQELINNLTARIEQLEN